MEAVDIINGIKNAGSFFSTLLVVVVYMVIYVYLLLLFLFCFCFVLFFKMCLCLWCVVCCVICPYTHV